VFSERFSKPVIVTAHARARMAQRDVDSTLLLDLIESGEIRHKDERRIWVAKHYSNRSDNLLCVALGLESSVIVKTLMHHFTWENEP
jgi:hypothetical protein